jgi:hypothetical protein
MLLALALALQLLALDSQSSCGPAPCPTRSNPGPLSTNGFAACSYGTAGVDVVGAVAQQQQHQQQRVPATACKTSELNKPLKT